MNKIDISTLPKKTLVELIGMLANNAITIDGLWFRGVEERFGLGTAVEIDTDAWGRYGSTEARRIRETLNITEEGIPALIKALNFQVWVRAKGFDYEILQPADNKVVFNITDCRVQRVRIKKGIGEFPCKPVGIALFEEFGKAVDPRFKFRCLVCPPDEHPENLWCSWEFTID